MNISARENRRLHALAAKRGLTHADLRAGAGVISLTLASADALRALEEKLDRDKPETRPGAPGPKPEARRRWRPGVLNLITNRQRGYLTALLRKCGDVRPKEWPEFGIADPQTVTTSSANANAAINSLRGLLRGARRLAPTDGSSRHGGREYVRPDGRSG